MTILQEHYMTAYETTVRTVHSLLNKQDIVKAKYQAARAAFKADPSPENGERQYMWDDMVVRAGWAVGFVGGKGLNKNVQSVLQHCIDTFRTSPGGYDLPKPTKGVRVRATLSFDQALCDQCKELEASFTPSDQLLRTETIPWYEQYYYILEALVADSYRIMGVGYTLDQEIAVLRTQAPYNTDAWATSLTYWDNMIEASRNFLYYGRNCYSSTEVTSRKWLDHLGQDRWKEVATKTLNKYLMANENTFKAIGGTYILNEELLCPDCAAHLEPDPIQIVQRGTNKLRFVSV